MPNVAMSSLVALLAQSLMGLFPRVPQATGAKVEKKAPPPEEDFYSGTGEAQSARKMPLALLARQGVTALLFFESSWCLLVSRLWWPAAAILSYPAT